MKSSQLMAASSRLLELGSINVAPISAGAISGEVRPASTLWEQSKITMVFVEVAPVSGAATDAELGVNEFQIKYFNGNPLFIDSELKFYEYLGSKSSLTQLVRETSWNPFKLYRDFNSLSQRLKTKQIEGNLKGEGLTKGGLLIISSSKQEVVYQHSETTGAEMPYDEIISFLKKLFEEEGMDSSLILKSPSANDVDNIKVGFVNPEGNVQNAVGVEGEVEECSKCGDVFGQKKN
eukprot:gene15298-20609_t